MGVDAKNKQLNSHLNVQKHWKKKFVQKHVVKWRNLATGPLRGCISSHELMEGFNSEGSVCSHQKLFTNPLPWELTLKNKQLNPHLYISKHMTAQLHINMKLSEKITIKWAKPGWMEGTHKLGGCQEQIVHMDLVAGLLGPGVHEILHLLLLLHPLPLDRTCPSHFSSM